MGYKFQQPDIAQIPIGQDMTCVTIVSPNTISGNQSKDKEMSTRKVKNDPELPDIRLELEAYRKDNERLRSILALAGIGDKGGKYLKRETRKTNGAFMPMDKTVSTYAVNDADYDRIKSRVLEVPASLQDHNDLESVLQQVSENRIKRELRGYESPYNYVLPRNRGFVKIVVNRIKNGCDKPVNYKGDTRSAAEFLADMFDGDNEISNAFREALPVDVPELIKGYGL